MASFVRANALRFPDFTALEDADTGVRTTWRELDARVDAIARLLRDGLGIAPRERLAYFATDRPLTFEVLFACMRAGIVFVPLNRRLSLRELEALCADADPACLLHDADWRDAASAIATSNGLRTASIEQDVLPRIDLAGGPMPDTPPARAPDEPFMLLYTSGTTGLPKGAIVTEGMLAAQTVNVLDLLDICAPPATYFNVLPLYHAASLMSVSLPLMIRGGAVCVASRFDPAQALALLGDPARGITHFTGAPVIFQVMAAQAPADIDFSHLRRGLVGGGHVPREVADFYRSRGLELQEGWGATETGPSATVVPRGCSVTHEHTVGTLVPLIHLRVVDDEGNDVAPGTIGEAWVNGPNVSPGYWRHSPAEDSAHIDGWYRTGDAVSVDADNFVTFQGRYKDMYKSGGENVFAAEVERVLMEHPGIAEVAVIGVPHPRWGEAGKAIIVRAAGADVSYDSVAALCRDRLAGYKVPAEIAFTENLPRNVTGKVMKADLRREFGGLPSAV